MTRVLKNNKQPNRRAGLILAISLCLLVVIIGIVFLVCFMSKVEIPIFVNGERTNSIEVSAGANIKISSQEEGKNQNTEVEYNWSISGDTLGCSIVPNGADCLLVVGHSSGTITVVVKTNKGNKEGVLKVTIAEKVLQSLSVVTMPEKTSYIEGQAFIPQGMKISAEYENFKEEVTEYVVKPNRPLVSSDTGVTVEYSLNGVTKTVVIPITVAPKTLESIFAKQTKDVYIEGEVLTTSSFIVTAHYEYCEQVVTSFKILNELPLSVGTTQVTLTYEENEIVKETSLLINVKPKTLQAISIESAALRTEYTEGELFDVTGIKVIKQYEFLQEIATEWTIDKGSFLVPNDKRIVVSCTENGVTKNAEISITVIPRKLQSIEVTVQPNTINYIEGQTFDSTGIEVVAHYEFMTIRVMNFTIDEVTSLLPTVDNISISYTENGITKQTLVAISVTPKTLQGLEIVSLPNKIQYVEGQSLLLDGLSVKAIYEFVEMPITDIVVEPKSNLKIGDEEVSISYTDGEITKSTTFNIEIIRRKLQSVSITTQADKLDYIEGEIFDSKGMVLTAHFEYFSENTINYSINNVQPLKPTDTMVEVIYTFDGVTKSVIQNISVAPKKLQSISINKMPNTNAYIEGQTFIKTGMEIMAHYEFIDMVVNNWTVDETTPLDYQATSVVVSYTENGITKTVEVPIEMSDNLLDYIEIVTPAKKLSYSCGEKLSMVGLSLQAHYTNGTSRMVGGFNNDKPNALTTDDTFVTISYTEASHTSRVTKTTTYDITVLERVLQSITLVSMPLKRAYVEGELFDLSGLIVSANYNDGTTQNVANFTLSKNTALSVEDEIIIVTYTENDITVYENIGIDVAERVLTDIQIISQPVKTEYMTGEKFVPDGMIVRAIYNDGVFSKSITGYTIENSDNYLTETDQSIVITYTENGCTKLTTLDIDVLPRTLVNIFISTAATKLNYVEGEYLDILGLSITAEYSDAPAAVVVGWVTDKANSLTLNDTRVVVSYTESGITKTVEYPIIVTALQLDAQVIRVIEAINSLPKLNELALTDESSLIYVGDMYTSLSASQKSDVDNVDKLLALLDKMIELKQSVESEPEKEYEITYELYGNLEFEDLDLTSLNLRKYKNSMGTVALVAPNSELAEQRGYEFVRWIDENGKTVSMIENLTENKTFYAIFELTNTVDIVFYDYFNKARELLTVTDVERKDFDIVANNIEIKVLESLDLVCLAFYVSNIEGKIVQVIDGHFETNYNKTITAYIVVAESRRIVTSSVNDFSLGYVYEYNESDGQTKSISKTPEVSSSFVLPVFATVTISIINPSIVDILLDEVPMGLTENQVDYIFTVEAGTSPLAISFDYYIAENVLITFKGLNTKIYSYPSTNWNKRMSSEDLMDVAFIYDESNERYLNRYIIDGTVFLFEDLSELEFEYDTTITVERVANEFSVKLEYTGGEYLVDRLTGRQKVEAALNAYSLQKSFLEEVFGNLTIYIDSARTLEIKLNDLYNIYLLEDITLYVANRTHWKLLVNVDGVETETIIPTDGDVPLSSVLKPQEKKGFIFKGYSLTENGAILTTVEIDVIVANRNMDTTLYAIYEKIEGYEPPEVVDYSGETFIGAWSASHSTSNGIVESQVILNVDGTYEYETKVNGYSSVKLNGEYKFSNEEIEVTSLFMDGDYQLINKAELKFNLEWVEDNVLIAPCFTVNEMTVKSYYHYLTKGKIRSANYTGDNILGEYEINLTTKADGVLTEHYTLLKLLANGSLEAEVSVSIDGSIVESFSENAHFRISSNREVWIISNASLGTFDVTEMLSNNFVKKGQDYLVVAQGSFVAANEYSSTFATLITLGESGVVTFFDANGMECTSKLNIKSPIEYTVFLQMDKLNFVIINVAEDGNYFSITLNGEENLRYEKII